MPVEGIIPVVVECDGQELRVVSSWWRWPYRLRVHTIKVEPAADHAPSVPSHSAPPLTLSSELNIDAFEVEDEERYTLYTVLSANKVDEPPCTFLSVERRTDHLPVEELQPAQLSAIQYELLAAPSHLEYSRRLGPWEFTRSASGFDAAHDNDWWRRPVTGHSVELAYRKLIASGHHLVRLPPTGDDLRRCNSARQEWGGGPLEPLPAINDPADDQLPVVVELEGRELRVISSGWRDNRRRIVVDPTPIKPAGGALPIRTAARTTPFDYRLYRVADEYGYLFYDVLVAYKVDRAPPAGACRPRPRIHLTVKRCNYNVPDPELQPPQLRAIQEALMRRPVGTPGEGVGDWTFTRTERGFAAEATNGAFYLSRVSPAATGRIDDTSAEADTVEGAYRRLAGSVGARNRF